MVSISTPPSTPKAQDPHKKSPDSTTLTPPAPSSPSDPKELGVEKTDRVLLSQSQERDWIVHVLSNNSQMRKDIKGWLAKEYRTESSQGEDLGKVGEAEEKEVGEEECQQEEQSDSAGCSAKEDGGQEHQEMQPSDNHSKRVEAEPQLAATGQGGNTHEKHKNETTTRHRLAQLAAQKFRLFLKFQKDNAPFLIIFFFIYGVILGRSSKRERV